MLLLVLGCGVPEPHLQDCDDGTQNCNDVTDTVCHDGNQILLDSQWDRDPDVHFEWSVADEFLEGRGSLVSQDTPTLVATCPACKYDGTVDYLVTVLVTDDKGQMIAMGFIDVQQICDDDE